MGKVANKTTTRGELLLGLSREIVDEGVVRGFTPTLYLRLSVDEHAFLDALVTKLVERREQLDDLREIEVGGREVKSRAIRWIFQTLMRVDRETPLEVIRSQSREDQGSAR